MHFLNYKIILIYKLNACTQMSHDFYYVLEKKNYLFFKMFGKKAAFFIVLSILIGLEWSNVYVSENFERPFLFKTLRLFIKTMLNSV